ncbi:MAG TPA: hypothetical protein PK548_05495 [Bacteroidales bacterium]|jgi:hypothetical protein|nr:hypothetical protein [Bacteroidales bacterium]HQA86934.1 hypothetical protein [Bacteroidales bacterium]
MKKIIILLFLVASSVFAFSQKVESKQIKFQKEKRSCVVGEYKVPKDIMETVVKKFFIERGLISFGKMSGFMVYEQASCPSVTSQLLDVYVKISGGKSSSSIILLASKGGDKFVGENEEGIYANFKNVLQDWGTSGEALYIQSQKEEQHKVLVKIEKEYQKLTKKLDGLNKKKNSLERDIQKTEEAQKKAKQKFDAEKQKLDSIQ